MNRPTLFSAFLSQVQSRPDAIALVGASDHQATPTGQQLTWMQLAERVAALAAAMQHLDHGPDPLLILRLHQNRLSDVCVGLASMAVGAIEIPVDARREPAQIDCMAQSTAGVWIDDDFVDRALEHSQRPRDSVGLLTSLAQNLQLDEPELILWTTGTTATPKGVVLSRRNLVLNAHAKWSMVPQTADDIRLTTLPLAHAYARTCDLGTWLLSGCMLVLSLGYRGWQTLANQYPPTLANVVPALAYRLLETPTSPALSRLKLLGVGGAPLRPNAFEQFRQLGITVIQGYGLTETSPVICSATPTNASAGLVGHPVSGCEVALRSGRLFVRGSNVMLGYWNDPTATSERIDEDGWLDTGDLAEVDETTGQYRILGRADDLIVLPNGNKCHPREIESLVEDLVDVQHAMLVCVDESLQLWLNLASTASEDDASYHRVRSSIEACLSRLPKWKRPQHIQRFVPPLSSERGELTHKGSLRRATVLANRFN